MQVVYSISMLDDTVDSVIVNIPMIFICLMCRMFEVCLLLCLDVDADVAAVCCCLIFSLVSRVSSVWRCCWVNADKCKF